MTTIDKDKVAMVHYRGTFPEDGEEFDSSHDREPLGYLVGATPPNMIPGFEREMMGAEVGEKREFTLMAEDAYGYDNESEYAPEMGQFKHNPDCKNILIVDDINDTGATFNWIKEDWKSSCLPQSPVWDQVWGDNVRFAVLTENLSSEFSNVKYHCDEVNKAEEDVWLVYPWENVGEY